jgi:uncharacterized membrane protein
VGIFPFFKRKSFFTADEQKRMVDTIREAEQQTSGEIRVFVESKNPLMDTVDRARTVFYKLKMNNTLHHNGVLIYLAVSDKEVAVFGDDGINKAVGDVFWKQVVTESVAHFANRDLTTGVEKAILHIGNALKEKFPYERTTDKNELPDEIVFGN